MNLYLFLTLAMELGSRFFWVPEDWQCFFCCCCCKYDLTHPVSVVSRRFWTVPVFNDGRLGRICGWRAVMEIFSTALYDVRNMLSFACSLQWYWPGETNCSVRYPGVLISRAYASLFPVAPPSYLLDSVENSAWNLPTQRKSSGMGNHWVHDVLQFRSPTGVCLCISLELDKKANLLKCEYCGKYAPASQFRGSKRFCSMTCAKR